MKRAPADRAVPLLLVAALGAAAVALVACDRSPPPPSPEVVAEVAGEEVRYAEFEAHVEGALGEGGDSLGSDVLSQLFDQFLEEKLLARLAAERGLLPEDSAAPGAAGGGAAGRFRRRRAVDALLAEATGGEAGITDAEVEAWYAAHADDFRRPPRVRLRQILTEDRATAEAAIAEIDSGTDFAEVARRLDAGVGVDGDGGPGAKDAGAVPPEAGVGGGAGFVGGSLGELSRDDLPPAFADVILELDPGEVSRVVEADYGFHLFQVTEKLPAETVPLEEARDEVERALLQERADRHLAELAEEARRRYDVSVWERNLPFNYRGFYRADAV